MSQPTSRKPIGQFVGGRGTLIVISVLAFSLAGCAGDGGTKKSTTKPASTIPSIDVVMACEGCDLEDGFRAQVAKGYDNAATKSGFKLSPDKKAVLTVTGYDNRSLVFMMIAGPLAMLRTDEIRGKLSYGGKDQQVVYSTRSMVPIERDAHLAKGLGEVAMKTLSN